MKASICRKVLVVCFFFETGFATIYRSTGDGAWLNGAIWNQGGTLPGASDTATIRSGHSISLSGDAGTVNTLSVQEGLLAVQNGGVLQAVSNLKIGTVGSGGILTVSAGGELSLTDGSLGLAQNDGLSADSPLGGTLIVNGGAVSVENNFVMGSGGASNTAAKVILNENSLLTVGSDYSFILNGGSGGMCSHEVTVHTGAMLSAGDLSFENGGEGISQTLILDGGAISMAGNFGGGDGIGWGDQMIISNGAVTVGNSFRCGATGRFTLTMVDGEMTIANRLLIPANEAGEGRFDLHGGTVTVSGNDDIFRIEAGRGLLDLQGDGTLILKGDYRTRAGNYMHAGWLTAYGGRGSVSIEYDFSADETVITAEPFDHLTAWNPEPADRAAPNSVPSELSWSVGEGALSHDVFFGTDSVAVATGSVDVFAGNHSGTTFDPGALAEGTSYFWRVDEVSASGTHTGAVWGFSLPSGTAAPDYYVSSTGDDSNPGTSAQPFATIKKARDTIRAFKTLPPGGVTVWLEGGTYSITDTLIFDEFDSGQSERPITYAALPGENPVISSGIPVTGWTAVTAGSEPAGIASKAVGQLWVADIPAGLESGFKTLYEGAEQLPRARSEGFQATNPGNDSSQRFFNYPEGTLRAWPNMQDVELYMIPASLYTMNILPLESVDEQTLTATLGINATYEVHSYNPAFDMFRGKLIWVENVPEALDEPGEWIVDTTAGKVYLWPTNSAPGNDIVAPSLHELIRVEGDEAASTAAHHLTFRGLTFMHGERETWTHTESRTQHEWEPLDKANSLLRLRWADDCVVENCRFVNSGGGGVRLDLRTQNNRIENNEFAHLGGTGILLCGYGPGTVDLNGNNDVLNNHIHHIGEHYWASSGIFIYQSADNRIANNCIHDVPYNGITVSGHRWPFFNPHRNNSRETASIRYDEFEYSMPFDADANDWRVLLPYLHGRNNAVEYNECLRVVQKLGDGNAIYVSGCGTNNVIRQNSCHDWYSHFSAGIRTDDMTHDAHIRENVIYRKFGGGITIKDRNSSENNLIVDILQPDRPVVRWGYIRIKDGPQEALQRNVLVHRNQDNPMFYYEIGDFIPWESQTGQVNSNFYYMMEDPSFSLAFLADKQAAEVDQDSFSQDPLVEDTPEGAVRLQSGSPVYSQIGFVPIEFDRIGLDNRRFDLNRDGRVTTADRQILEANLGKNNLIPYIPMRGVALGWWRFDEGAGAVAADSSGYHRDGILEGAIWTNGVAGTALDFSSDGSMAVDGDILSELEDGITVCFWQFGAEVQPVQDVILQAANEEVRILNVHLPWADGRVIWDAGGEDGYDRLEKTADPADYKGAWNHWAFTKNTSEGTMKIYLNGSLWHSSSGNPHPIGSATDFRVGSNAAGTDGFYAGRLDDFRIYGYELNSDEIQEVYQGYHPLPGDFRTEGYLTGDLNFDGKVNEVDSMMLSNSVPQKPGFIFQIFSR
jgi:hypothetical protein